MTLCRSLVTALLLHVSLIMFNGNPLAAQPSQPPVAAPAPSAPQPATKSFLPPRAGGKIEASAPPSGPLAGLYMWVAQQQRAMSQTMAAALRDIKSGNTVWASAVLIFFSFAYGVLHAAGPGHGKAIVSSYMLADGQTVRRGIQLAFLSSLVQALAAILLFSIVVLVLRGARTEIVNTETFLERASWAIVAMFGAWLLVRQIRGLWTGRAVHDHGHDHGHDHEHGHDHKHAQAPAALMPAIAGSPLATANVHRHDHVHDTPAVHRHAHSHHNNGHHNNGRHDNGHHNHKHAAGDACDTCGHAHMPTADALQGVWSWRRAMTLALAIGIRPCTGAVGVLFVANGLGLMLAGVISTFAMAIGTAITVSALAALAVGSRDFATRIAGVGDNSWASTVQTAIGLAGAFLVFALGATFFFYSLATPAPL